MPVSTKYTYGKNEVTQWPVPNYWDWLAALLVATVILLLGWGAHSMLGRFNIGQTVSISLHPKYLPYYALLTVLRMLVALVFSLLFTFVFATWAAKSRAAERVIIPLIDILQSVPPLGFLSIIVVGFIVLFKGSLLGPECAAIFTIFTAQVWNISLAFYQSLKMLPHDMIEVSAVLQLSTWQKFWRVEVPFAMPILVWNVMLSMSSSWIFLVASEAISVANHQIYLPGVGSYIALAILQSDMKAIFYVIITMMVVIGLVDQLLFRPIVAWSEKFKLADLGSDNEPESWLLNLFQRTRFIRHLGRYLGLVGEKLVNFRAFNRQMPKFSSIGSSQLQSIAKIMGNLVVIILAVTALTVLVRFILFSVSISEIGFVMYDACFTAVRVMAAILISSVIWVPIGVWVGRRPRVTAVVQPIAQFLAAFPMSLVFPLIVWLILRFALNVNIWVSPLMVLGAQWYLLFNVIAGTAAIPKNLHHAVGTLNVRGWLWWRKFILPGIYPYYITGAITAAGAAWNVSIIAEAVSWGHTQLWARGIGAYIVKASESGDFHRLALGIVVMALYVLLINHFVWKPLHNLAERRFRMS